MNPLIQLKTTPPLLIILTLLCFTLLPPVQATPDPGSVDPFNTADGDHALFSNTTGVANSAFGWYALFGNTDGSNNTAVGTAALDLNTGNDNTAVGTAALLLNTGSDNTAVGVAALETNSTGSNNTASGAFALFSNSTGVANTASGGRALFNNTEGNFNTASGFFALHDNTGGVGNTANGASALQNNTTGGLNTAIGGNALMNNTEGTENTATGANALSSNIVGGGNTATGVNALFSSNTGSDNVATGGLALYFNTTGDGNTANGREALANNTTGTISTALGWKAGLNVTTADDVICIGAAVFGENVSNSCYIGNIFNSVSASGVPVLVNASDKLGTTTSSKRFKKDIKPMDKASEALLALKPVTFHYKEEIDPAGISQFGLVAEDVEKVNPALVVRDKEGKPYSVRYDQVNAMLLNEFLKEHRKNEQQEAMIAHQQKQIEALTAGLQKVSAQLELNKPAPQVVNNP